MMLVSKGAMLTDADGAGKTPYDLARECGFMTLVQNFDAADSHRA